VPARVHDDGTADADVRPEEAPHAAIDALSVGDGAELGEMRDAGEVGEWGAGVEDQRHQRLEGRRHGVAEPLRDLPAATIAAALWKGAAARRHHDPSRVERSVRVVD